MITKWADCQKCKSHHHWMWQKREGGYVKEVVCIYPEHLRLPPDVEDNEMNRLDLEFKWHKKKYILQRQNSDEGLYIIDCPKSS